ncbi:peptide chain release factor 1 [Alphaproteobacteria bacterium]|nr:peptide chain release factor 1 [Alphaproteobacteria bacterium]
MSLQKNIDKITQREDTIEKLLVNSSNLKPTELAELSKELSDIKSITDLTKKKYLLDTELLDLNEMLNDKETDNEIKSIASIEVNSLKEKLFNLERDIQFSLLPKDKDDTRNVIIEVRAGTGGDEAGLFASDLFAMYDKLAIKNKWKFEVMEVSESSVGGYKEAQANIIGKGVFGRLKFESGVHRVQRVPTTETSGRIHTSAATVAVLPEAEDLEILIEDKDLRIDVFRSSGPGGQSVNTTDSAVRITHIPSGIVVSQQDEKSQHKNRAKAMKILQSRLYEAERQKQQDKRSSSRKDQVGSGDRSERIRTYNFPQGRVTDHRINLTLHKLDKVLQGEALDELIDALIVEDRMLKLATNE